MPDWQPMILGFDPFGASTAAEDERDLDKVHFDINRMNCMLRKVSEMARDVLSTEELESLAWGKRLINIRMRNQFWWIFCRRYVFQDRISGAQSSPCPYSSDSVQEIKINLMKCQIVERVFKGNHPRYSFWGALSLQYKIYNFVKSYRSKASALPVSHSI